MAYQDIFLKGLGANLNKNKFMEKRIVRKCLISQLGLLLFSIFINDIDKIKSAILNLVNDDVIESLKNI